MKILKDRILKDGRCYPGGILKVDNFINHQMDPIPDEIHRCGVRQTFCLHPNQQNYHGRSQRYRSRHYGRLFIGITRSLRKKEKAEHYGEHADYFCLFFHQATLL